MGGGDPLRETLTVWLGFHHLFSAISKVYQVLKRLYLRFRLTKNPLREFYEETNSLECGNETFNSVPDRAIYLHRTRTVLTLIQHCVELYFHVIYICFCGQLNFKGKFKHYQRNQRALRGKEDVTHVVMLPRRYGSANKFTNTHCIYI